jgi:hypothetical protein
MKKIWFKAKEYGYGWYPATWEGWATGLIFIIAIVIAAVIFETNVEKFLVPYLITVFTLSGLLIFISYKKGEKPGWRWGKKK